MWVQRVEAEEGATGLNAATGELTDLVKAGIVDPGQGHPGGAAERGVDRGDGAHHRGLVADKPEPAPAMPAGGGGGMGGMPGMM